jgi:hypothetical protein
MGGTFVGPVGLQSCGTCAADSLLTMRHKTGVDVVVLANGRSKYVYSSSKCLSKNVSLCSCLSTSFIFY